MLPLLGLSAGCQVLQKRPHILLPRTRCPERGLCEIRPRFQPLGSADGSELTEDGGSLGSPLLMLEERAAL